MAKLIKPDGTILDVQPANGIFSLDEMYRHCECSMVQMCDGRNGKTLVFDEEGLCRGDIVKHPRHGIAIERHKDGTKTYEPWLNRLATQAMHPRMGPFVHNVICGNCLVVSEDELENDEDDE